MFGGLAGAMFGWGFGFDDGYGIDRSGFAEKSQAAQRRQDEAVELFNAMRKEAEGAAEADCKRVEQEVIACDTPLYRDVRNIMLSYVGAPAAGEKSTFELLKPSCHLTGACFKDFRKHVRGFTGWSVVRREATPAEKMASGETRRGKVYFTSVVYNPKIKKRKAKDAQAKENKRQKQALAQEAPANVDAGGGPDKRQEEAPGVHA